MEIIISSMLVFISTSIDYLVVLTILFSTMNTGKQRSIYIGQYIGTGLLIGFSLIAAYFLNFIPQDWIIGLLGLIPLGLGIRSIFVDEDIDEEVLKRQKPYLDGERFSMAFFYILIAMGIGSYLSMFIDYLMSFTGFEALILA